jgi:[acyl-carrier-protein] S-malonyltransferase
VSERVAFVFPGQGSQAVGMGADVFRASPAARAVYALADEALEALGFALSTLCFEGPEERLRETINTQPALVVTSLALLAALQERARTLIGEEPGPEASSGPDATIAALDAPLTPAYVAGHSVGEYAALVACGALDVAATLRLVRERGRLMQDEGVRCPSGMAAVLGMDRAALEVVCAEARAQAAQATQTRGDPETAARGHPGVGSVVIANDNAPGQLVLSGERQALEVAMALAKERGARRVVPLAVSGAFHSPVMAPATAGLAAAVAQAPLRDARVPLIANITATPLARADELRAELAQQIESPVQWTRTVEYLVAQGITRFVEIGPGQVLGGLIKRIAKSAQGINILSLSTAEDVAPVARQLLAHGDGA